MSKKKFLVEPLDIIGKILIVFTVMALFIWLIAKSVMVVRNTHWKYYILSDRDEGFYTDSLERLDEDCILTDGMFEGDRVVHCGKYFVFDGENIKKRIYEY